MLSILGAYAFHHLYFIKYFRLKTSRIGKCFTLMIFYFHITISYSRLSSFHISLVSEIGDNMF